MAEDQKETLAAWAPQGLRVLRGSPGMLDPWEKGGQLACEVSRDSKAQRAALEVEAREDSQAPKEMWGPQGQRGPQGPQDPQGLRENRESLERRVHKVSGGPWGLRVNPGSRVPLACPGPQAHQEARAATEQGPSPRHCHTECREGDSGQSEPTESKPTDSCGPLILKSVAPRPAPAPLGSPVLTVP